MCIRDRAGLAAAATAARAGARVVGLPGVGGIVYMLLRPRETIAERYERGLIEELLAREVSTGTLSRRAARSAAAGGS